MFSAQEEGDGKEGDNMNDFLRQHAFTRTSYRPPTTGNYDEYIDMGYLSTGEDEDEMDDGFQKPVHEQARNELIKRFAEEEEDQARKTKAIIVILENY